MAHILPDKPFLPRPPEGWPGFAEGTDPNGVPRVPVDVPSGWACPRCGHCYAPWVPECRHCPEPERPAAMFGQYALNVPAGGPGIPQGAIMQLRFPPEWSEAHYQHIVRAGGDWRDVVPGLQCRIAEAVDLTLLLRLTPDVWSDDPA